MTKTRLTALIKLAESIRTANPDWHNDRIFWMGREDSPPTELGEVELVDLHRAPYSRAQHDFFHNPSDDNAKLALDTLDYRPASVEELCDWSAKNPGELKATIVALGSIFAESAGMCHRYYTRLSSVLSTTNGVTEMQRRFDLQNRNIDLKGPCYLFAAVKVRK